MITDLRGRPLQDLRISVTDRCNFRCTYCMPIQQQCFMPHKHLLSFEEITRAARLFAALGVHKIRLTGGEPLLRRHIEALVEQLAQISGITDLAMITNGYLLPQKAQVLKDAGLHRLTISLDSMDNAVFRAMNGTRADVEHVLAGIKVAERAGFFPLKINTVVQRGVNDHTLVDLAHYFKDRGHIVRFIEYMDAGTLNGWQPDKVFSAAEIVAAIDAAFPLEAIAANYPGEVAQRYRYRDGSGEIGVIASVTQPFCGGCTRLRLSAEGQLYTCLFAGDGYSLREKLRSGMKDTDLLNDIAILWRKRTDRYSEVRPVQTAVEKIEMHYIGG